MAEPTRYTPGYNYSGWEADHPTEPKPGAELDNDFALIRHSIDETIRALEDVRRSDGKVQNATVDFDALSPAVKAAIAGSEFDYEVIEDLLAKEANLQDIPDKIAALVNLGADLYIDSAAALSMKPMPVEVNHVSFSDTGGIFRSLVRGSEAPGAIRSADGQWWEDVGYNTITVRIPSQFPTLQAAVDHYSRLPMRQGAVIELLIESGHQPASGIAVKDGDYGKFVVRSEDTVVTLDATIGRGGAHFISGDNAVMPVLDCLIDANEQLTQGYYATNGSRGRVTDGNGIYNVWGTGLYVRSSFVVARNTVWTDCAINGNTGSGIICWSGHLDAEGADVSRSGYYGAQSAYGAVTNLTDAVADDCARYGFRCRNASTLNVESGRANNCGVNALRAFNNGYVAARYFVGKNAGDAGLSAQGASVVQAQDTDFSGGQNNGMVALGGSLIDARNANAQRGPSPSSADFFVAAGSTIYTGSGAVGGLSQPANAVTGQGVIFDNSQSTPFPDGTYEQWTPEITCGTPGDLAVSYSTQIGRLVRLGKLIVATFTIETSSFTHSTASGALRIAGLPDNSVTTANVSWYGALSYGGLAPAAGATELTLELNHNSTDINIRSGGSGQSRGFLGVNHAPSGNDIVLRGTVSYWTQ